MHSDKSWLQEYLWWIAQFAIYCAIMVPYISAWALMIVFAIRFGMAGYILAGIGSLLFLLFGLAIFVTFLRRV